MTEVFREKIGTRKADLLVGTWERDLLIGKMGNDFLIGDAGDDRLEGGSGHDTLHGGPGNDLLYGGQGRDTYQWNAGDLDLGMHDRVFDDRGSRLEFDALLLEDLLLDGKSLDSLSGRKIVGNHIDARNTIAFKEGSLLIDLDGDGTFNADIDARIELIGNASRLVFFGNNDMFVLG